MLKFALRWSKSETSLTLLSRLFWLPCCSVAIIASVVKCAIASYQEKLLSQKRSTNETIQVQFNSDWRQTRFRLASDEKKNKKKDLAKEHKSSLWFDSIYTIRIFFLYRINWHWNQSHSNSTDNELSSKSYRLVSSRLLLVLWKKKQTDKSSEMKFNTIYFDASLC